LYVFTECLLLVVEKARMAATAVTLSISDVRHYQPAGAAVFP
jgi:hypothetical protein